LLSVFKRLAHHFEREDQFGQPDRLRSEIEASLASRQSLARQSISILGTFMTFFAVVCSTRDLARLMFVAFMLGFALAALLFTTFPTN
jgi:hypothetical protein